MNIAALRREWDTLNQDDPGYLTRWVVRRISGIAEADAAAIAAHLTSYVEGVLDILSGLTTGDENTIRIYAYVLAPVEALFTTPPKHYPKAQAGYVLACYAAERILEAVAPILQVTYTSPWATLREPISNLINYTTVRELDSRAFDVAGTLKEKLDMARKEAATAAQERALNTAERALTGNWVFTDFYFSGSFSARTEIFLLLGADGHFTRTTASAANMLHRDASGNYLGATAAESGLSPDHRGTWAFNGRTLSLQYDDKDSASYSVERDGASMLLNGKLYQRTR